MGSTCSSNQVAPVSTLDNTNPNFGKLKFDGKSSICKYIIVQVPAENTGDDKTFEYANRVSEELFCGQRPDIGWWWKKTGSESHSHGAVWWPPSIISVTGGAENFKISKEYTTIFKKGIVKAASAMKAMIIDGGSASGVMLEVGKAVEEDGDQIATLGIIPWKVVSAREESNLKPVGKPTCSLQYDYNVRKYRHVEKTTKNENETVLDSNHRYFAFVDVAHTGQPEAEQAAWGLEIPFRFHLECALSGRKDPNQGDLITPHVVVVVGGGMGTFKTVCALANIEKTGGQTSIPIVIIENSGELPDFLIKLRGKPRPSDKAAVQKIWPKGIAGDDAAYTMALKICSLPEEALTFHRFDSDESLSYVLMKSICNGTLQQKQGNWTQLSPLQRLRYVLEWDDDEAMKMAKREVLMNIDEKEKTEKSGDYSKILMEAMYRNRYKFVDLVLDFDFKLTESDFIQLYKERLIAKGETTEWLYDEHDRHRYDVHMKVTKSLENLKGLSELRKIRKDRGKKNQKDSQDLEHEQDNGEENLNIKKSFLKHNVVLSNYFGWERNKDDHAIRSSRGGPVPHEENGVSGTDVFIWSILTGRREIAHILWRHLGCGQQSITTALFACAIARTVGPLLDDESKKLFIGDLEVHGNSHSGQAVDFAAHFEMLAVDLLDMCYRKSKDQTICILLTPLLLPKESYWVSTHGSLRRALRPISLALDAAAKRFVAHDAFQDSLDQLWMGRIESKDKVTIMNNADEQRGILNPRGFRLRHEGLLRGLARLLGLEVWFFPNSLMAGIDHLLTCLLLIPIFKSKRNSSRRYRIPEPGVRNQVEFYVNIALQKWCSFYAAPVSKFYLDFASYFAFVVLYTAVGLTMSYEYTVQEALMHTWIFSFALGEFRNYLDMGLIRYNRVNKYHFDVLVLVLYIPAAALRIFEIRYQDQKSFDSLGGNFSAPLQDGHLAVYNESGRDFWTARSWHGVAGIFFWVRILVFCRISSDLGPMVLVLQKVSWNAFELFVFLLVFMIGFGAAMICAGRPRADPRFDLSSSLQQAIFFTYIEIFGEHYLNGFELSFDDYPLCDDASKCSTSSNLGIILLCIYLFISGIVLMNLLIASE